MYSHPRVLAPPSIKSLAHGRNPPLDVLYVVAVPPNGLVFNTRFVIVLKHQSNKLLAIDE